VVPDWSAASDNPAGFVAAGRVDLACDCGLLSSGSNLARESRYPGIVSATPLPFPPDAASFPPCAAA